jgi:hypothetical protein
MRIPGYTAEASVQKTSNGISVTYRSNVSGSSWIGRAVIPQQLDWPWQCNLDPSALSTTCCLPCFWGRRRCCTYTHGGDLLCYSDRC